MENPWTNEAFGHRVALLAKDKRYQSVLAPYLSGDTEGANWRLLLIDHTMPLFREAVEYTAFALDEFRRRVDADGGELWLLLAASPRYRANEAISDIMTDLAETRGIPVLSQQDYIVRQGHRVGDAIFPQDGHWNAAGHQWAAETMLERLRELPPSEGPCQEK